MFVTIIFRTRCFNRTTSIAIFIIILIVCYKVRKNEQEDIELKEDEYIEYKHRKQKFLLDLDYQSLCAGKKDKILSKYNSIYIEKIDIIYKGLLKNYSVKLADGLRAKRVNQVELYKKIFETLEDYIKKNELHAELDEYATDIEVGHAVDNASSIKYSDFELNDKPAQGGN